MSTAGPAQVPDFTSRVIPSAARDLGDRSRPFTPRSLAALGMTWVSGWGRTLALLAISLLALGVTGCKDDNATGGTAATTQASSASPGGTKKMAVVVSTLNNPWFVVLAETARDRAKELGYEATIFDSQNDPARESAHFDNAITARYDAILFNCTNADGSVANVRRAKDAGIPVFCIDREINASDAAVSQILSDNYTGCVTLGQYFVKRVGDKGKYAELLGLPGDNNTWNRSKGFHSVVDRFPGLQMVAQQSADFDRARALEVMEAILQANPDVNAVFCGNDAMAMGAYQAVRSAGKEGKVMIFGFDGADDVVKAIADGKIEATMMQFPKLMARTAAESADKYIQGERSFPQKLPVAVELVTKANVDKFGDYGKKDAK